jgi:hypothetical protein
MPLTELQQLNLDIEQRFTEANSKITQYFNEQYEHILYAINGDGFGLDDLQANFAQRKAEMEADYLGFADLLEYREETIYAGDMELPFPRKWIEPRY